LDRACKEITGVRDYPLVWVGRKDDGPDKRVIPVACSGIEKDYLDDLDVRWSEDELGQGPTGRAIRKNEAQVQERISLEEDESYSPWRDKAEAHDFSASIALPIPRGEDGDVFGALNIYIQNRSTVSDSRVELLQELANDLGYGLQHIKTQKELREMTIGTLEALSRTVEAKDEYTADHIDRVKNYALEMGRSLNLSQERLDQLSYASELHDVGKVRIPDSILGKPEELTEEEWDEMEKHPTIGAEIVGKIPRLKRAAKIVAQHQEKYDGTGYPEGLEGEEITLEARIIAVVDAWDAMQTDRPYRDAIPREEAIKELTENAGSQFDPDIVDEFLKLLDDTGPEN
jgi:HD-GYP domain-containing protein (c-di-GMP phosphodiesterase class II)